MGKKRVIKKSEEEVLQEAEKQESVERKAAQTVKGKRKKVTHISRANVYVKSTYNNTLVTLTDVDGRVIAWSSAGAVGFKGPKKATPFAASRVIETLMEKVKNIDIKEMAIFVKGIGSGRESAIRALANYNINIVRIKDVTPVPHNGCRLCKPKRL